MAAMKDPMAAMAPEKGHGDLNQFIDSSTLECLNECPEHSVSHAFDGQGHTFLQSDPETDSQLLISIGFRIPVKLSSIKVTVPDGAEEETPTKLKIFTGRDDTIGFSEAEERVAVQELDIIPGAEMPVRFVKFQGVAFMKIFVPGSAGDITTKIKSIQFTGTPSEVCDMKDWKPAKG